MRRVVITGIGCLASLGRNRDEVWSALLNGRCGIGPVTLFETDGYRSRIAAQLPDAALGGFTALERRRLSRCDRASVIAADEALVDSGIQSTVPPERIGVLLGSGTADLYRNEDYLQDLRAHGIRRARPSQVFNHFASTPVDVVGERFGLYGRRACIVAACSSSTIAIGCAADAIRHGELDAAVTGGADVLCRLTFSGFNALRLVDVEPCRPFAAGRAGMSIGEASAMLVLEEAEHARRRGAAVYAELAGFSATCEAFHATSPEPEGRAVSAAIDAALVMARINPMDVDHVNAHGTGTVHNDRAEARAFARVFGDRACEVPVTSIKSMVGHCLGAAGAIEAVALALTIARGVIPPTIHHDSTDPDCCLDIVANAARETQVRCGVSTSLAFGGNDSALVMRRYQ